VGERAGKVGKKHAQGLSFSFKETENAGCDVRNQSNNKAISGVEEQ